MNIKVIITDIDGTLLNSDKNIPTETIEFLQNFKASFGEVILATGRAYPSAKKILESLGLDGIIISYNGAKIVDSTTNKIIYHNPIKKELTRKLIDFSRKHNLHLNLYIGDDWYVESSDKDKISYYTILAQSEPIILNFDNLPSFETTKALFFSENHILKNLDSELRELVGDSLDLTYSSPYFLELSNKGVNKGSAVESVLKSLNLSSENAIAFGDELNDLEMLQFVKYGVAMGNSNSVLNEKIVHKTLSNNENGVLNFLKDFIPTNNKSYLESLMISTRSQREFQGPTVPMNILEKIVSSTRYAGSTKNSQEIRYILVNNKDILNSIFPFTRWAGNLSWNPEISNGPRGYIILCSNTSPSISENYLNFDMGLATGNITLTSKSLGYDCCILGAFNKEKIHEILEVPTEYKIHYLIAIGKGIEKISIIPSKEKNTNYYRVNGEHFVPKLTTDTLIIKKIS